MLSKAFFSLYYQWQLEKIISKTKRQPFPLENMGQWRLITPICTYYYVCRFAGHGSTFTSAFAAANQTPPIWFQGHLQNKTIYKEIRLCAPKALTLNTKQHRTRSIQSHVVFSVALGSHKKQYYCLIKKIGWLAGWPMQPSYLSDHLQHARFIFSICTQLCLKPSSDISVCSIFWRNWVASKKKKKCESQPLAREAPEKEKKLPAAISPPISVAPACERLR